VKQWPFQLLEKPNDSKLTKMEEQLAFPVENFNKISWFPQSMLNVFNKRADEFPYINREENRQICENSLVSMTRRLTGLLFLLR
jgi:hypothetical protein